MRDIAVLVPGNSVKQDRVYVVNAVNGATAVGRVSNMTNFPRSELRIVQLERVDA